MPDAEAPQENPVEFMSPEDLTQDDVDYLSERGMFPGVVRTYPKNTSLAAIVADVRARAERAATTCPTCGGTKPGENVMIQSSRPVAVTEVPISNRELNGSEKSPWGSVDGVHDISGLY